MPLWRSAHPRRHPRGRRRVPHERPGHDQGIQAAVSIPVMAKCRIGHFAEAPDPPGHRHRLHRRIEVLSPADDTYHIDKTVFAVPFVCGARDLGEALRRMPRAPR